MKQHIAAHKVAFLVVMIVAATTIAGAAVMLTPGSGVITALVVARANFIESTDVRFKVKDGSQEVINVRDAAETVVQNIVLAPNGHTGWHSHPGPVVVLIKSGTM